MVAMTDDHAAAKAMYRDYLARAAVLERNRRFADDVARATSGSGQTPVEPLATMGKSGGPLVCDVCGKPMFVRKGKRGPFLACSGYPKCKNTGEVPARLIEELGIGDPAAAGDKNAGKKTEDNLDDVDLTLE